ncbi:MAG TPA: efflux RND transporter permease subunit, partial [Bacteroidales bacterium]|nr:efflux RND transporter permease subunit [Bacteroidales bacterium]
PMLSARLLKLRPTKEKPGRISHSRLILPLLDKLDDFYVASLRFALKRKRLILLLALALFISSFGLMRYIGTDFLPESDESSMSVAIELQTGTRVEETIKTTRKLERLLQERYPEIEIMASSSGADDEGSMFSLFRGTGSNIINFMMRLQHVEERQRSVWEIADDLRAQLATYPEIVTATVSTSTGGMGMGGSNTVDIEVYGYDFDQTNRVAEQIRKKLADVKGATDITVSRKNDKPELQVVLDKEKMALHGLNSATVSTMLRNRISGLITSQFKEEGDEYDIRIRLEESYRNSISDLEEITVVNPMGKKIKLREIARVEEYWGPPSIQHKRKERVVTIAVRPQATSLGELAANVQAVVDEVDIPQEVLVQIGGAYEDQQESFMDLGLLMLLSLILVFIVMASQFESFTMPFIIMFSIPFAFTGVILALFLTGTTLSIIAGLGAVLLIGIVVKNGIVLVDFTNLIRDRGLKLNEAIIAAGRSRLRPVLMTALTTILGMLPLALSQGEGAEIWRPMGITVIGGLVFSTIVTMIIVPVMYGLLARTGERDKVMKLRRKFSHLD